MEYMKITTRNVDGVTVVDVIYKLRRHDWVDGAKSVAYNLSGFLRRRYGDGITNFHVRAFPVIQDIARVISHGLDRYSPDVVSQYDTPEILENFDPTRIAWSIPLSRGPYNAINLVTGTFAVRPRFEEPSLQGVTGPAGLLLLRESNSVQIGWNRYAYSPGSLELVAQLHI